MPIARLNREKLQILADNRIEEAGVLLQSKHWTGAYYLTGLTNWKNWPNWILNSGETWTGRAKPTQSSPVNGYGGGGDDLHRHSTQRCGH